MSILIAFIIFGLIILVHEFGHFIVARKNGIVVEEFAIGMGPLIYGKQKGDTLYSIRLLPIGGYCKMLGADEDAQEEGSYTSKNVFQRMAVIIAGSSMNFVLSFILILIILSVNGHRSLIVENVTDGSPGYYAGLMPGDRIISIDNSRLFVFANAQTALFNNNNTPVEVLFNREGQRLTLVITPEHYQGSSYIIGFNTVYFAGFFGETPDGVPQASIFQTLAHSFWTVLHYIRIVIVGLTQLFTFNVPLDDVAGLVGIVNIIGDVYEAAIEISPWVAATQILNFAALLSANIAVFNLFPIPALDGGRLVFLFVEAVRGKPISSEKEGFIHLIGLALLIGLIIIVTFNDILGLFR